VRRAAALLAFLLGGCGGFSAGDAEGTAREWVDAVNRGDVAQACEVTAMRRDDCERWVAEQSRQGELRVIQTERSDAGLVVSLSTPLMRGEERPPRDLTGWVAVSAPQFAVELVDGEYRVHPEVAVIR
jgi:hypothetical protein